MIISYLRPQVCRRLDNFCSTVYRNMTANKNVELHGRDTMKLFQHGVSHFIRKGRRIDGGWHIAIARHMQIFMGTTNLICAETKSKFARVYDLLFEVHSSLRLPVHKTAIPRYQENINDLLEIMIDINTPSTKSECNSIKYHWPRHWSNTRLELGCAAAEKSLERKLGEIQKKYFSYTNSRHNVDVSFVMFCVMFVVMNITVHRNEH